MRTSNRVAIFSDLHLGVHMNSSNWHNIALDWAKWYAGELRKQTIDTVIFCGDFFHNRSEITVNTLHKANDILEEFKDFNLIMLVGNHDSFYKNTSTVNSIKIFSGRKNITVVDTPRIIDINGTECFFSPWGTSIEKFEKCDIIFGHFEIQTFKMNQYKICEEGYNSNELLSHAPLVVSGHFHLREERVYKNGTILYVGSPFELDFGDEGDKKGYYLLDVGTKKFDFFENNISPKHNKINLSQLIKIKDFNKDAKPLLHNNFIKVIIDKTVADKDLERLRIKLNTFTPANLILDNTASMDKFLTHTPDSIDLSGVDITKAISDFVDMLDIQNKKDVTEYTVSLYNQCK